MDNARKSERQGVSKNVTKIATGAIKAALGEDNVDPSKVDNEDSVKEVLEKVQCFCNCVLGLDWILLKLSAFWPYFAQNVNLFQL